MRFLPFVVQNESEPKQPPYKRLTVGTKASQVGKHDRHAQGHHCCKHNQGTATASSMEH